MERYLFDLIDGKGKISMDDGIEFPTEDAAIQYGRRVVQELMRNRNEQTRRWRLDIFRIRDGECVAQLPFSEIDPTLDQLSPKTRASIKRWSATYLSLAEQIPATRATVRQSRALLARAKGKPYLIATGGRLVRNETP
jgi:hypothetical protein